MTRLVAVVLVLLVLIAACGGGSDGLVGFADERSGGSELSDIDVCALLTGAELTAVLGEAPLPKESEPAGPFTSCSWGTGDVLVSVAQTGSLILAPGEDECPSAQLGEESYACEGRVKFLVNGTHISVTTIDAFVTDAHLLALAQAVLPKIAG